jgi:hypothetical protein
MKRSGWRRPSPALVIACLALFVALGGTVLAATKINGHTIVVKSLPGNRLEVGSVPGNRLKGTISGDRISPGSIKGDRIDVGSLGQVPSAGHADSADTARHAQTAAAADHAADATTVNGRAVGCPGSRREFAGACWDLQASAAAANAIDAAAACAADGGELPNALTFAAFAQQPGVSINLGGEWTAQVEQFDGPGIFPAVYLAPGGVLYGDYWKEPRHYRCVTPLLH